MPMTLICMVLDVLKSCIRMNNKEFIAELSRRLGYTVKDASSLMVALVAEMTDELEDENVIAIQNKVLIRGTFLEGLTLAIRN